MGVDAMNDVMSIINLSDPEDRIKEMTMTRTTASLPILGRYRVIDFMLSNITNSGIKNVSIYTYGKTRSLTQHLGSGKHWGLDRKRDGLYLFHPDRVFENNMPIRGDLENFINHLDYLKYSSQKYVVMSRSYMICNIDLRPVVEAHKKNGADMTVVYKSLENNVGRFMGCDTLKVDNNQNVISMGKSMGKERYYNISLEMYVMEREKLIEIIEKSVQHGDANFLKEAIINRMGELKVKGYPFKGYLSCVNSIENYYNTNKDLLSIANANDLFGRNGKIYTKVMDAPSTKYTDKSCVMNSLIANGCIIEGTVENSVIFRGVHVKKGAIIRNSVVLPNVEIGETTSLNYAIVDKNVKITDKKMLFGAESSLFVIKKNSVL